MKVMKRNKFIKAVAGTILVAAMTTFTSCEKDEIIEPTPAVEVTNTVTFKVNGNLYTITDFTDYKVNPETLFLTESHRLINSWLQFPDPNLGLEPVNEQVVTLARRVNDLVIEVVSYSSDIDRNEIREHLKEFIAHSVIEHGVNNGWGTAESGWVWSHYLGHFSFNFTLVGV